MDVTQTTCDLSQASTSICVATTTQISRSLTITDATLVVFLFLCLVAFFFLITRHYAV